MGKRLTYQENGLTFVCGDSHLSVWRGDHRGGELLDMRKWVRGMRPTNEEQLKEAVHQYRETTEPHPWETPLVVDIEGVIRAPQGAASADLQAILDHLVEQVTGIRLIPLEDVMRLTFPTWCYLEVHRRTGEVLAARVITPADPSRLQADRTEDEGDLDQVREAVVNGTWPEPEWES